MYIYIIECAGETLYTGIAKNIEKRLHEHYYQEKTCAKFTKSHQMQNLKALWIAENKNAACKLEYHIKKLTRDQKLELINNPENLNSLFSEKINPENYEYINSKQQQIIMQKIKTKE